MIVLPDTTHGRKTMRRCITLISSLAALASFHVTSSAAILSAAAITPNSLVITEYMADPIGVSDSEGEYFEIYNTTSFDIDLNDLIVKDDGSNSFTITGLTIGAGAFAIFSNFDGVALGAGTAREARALRLRRPCPADPSPGTP